MGKTESIYLKTDTTNIYKTIIATYCMSSKKCTMKMLLLEIKGEHFQLTQHQSKKQTENIHPLSTYRAQSCRRMGGCPRQYRAGVAVHHGVHAHTSQFRDRNSPNAGLWIAGQNWNKTHRENMPTPHTRSKGELWPHNPGGMRQQYISFVQSDVQMRITD